jgi:hypothetical protein
MRRRARAVMKAFIRGTATADDVAAVMVLRPPVPQRSADEVLALAMLNRAGPEVGSWEWAQDFRAAMSPVQYAQLREAYLRRFGPLGAGEE